MVRAVCFWSWGGGGGRARRRCFWQCCALGLHGLVGGGVGGAWGGCFVSVGLPQGYVLPSKGTRTAHGTLSLYRNVEHMDPTLRGPNHINICCHICSAGTPHFHISKYVGNMLPHFVNIFAHFPTFVHTFVGYLAYVDQHMFPRSSHTCWESEVHPHTKSTYVGAGVPCAGARLPSFACCLHPFMCACVLGACAWPMCRKHIQKCGRRPPHMLISCVDALPIPSKCGNIC
jgi:hypothetical protein